MQRDKNSNRSRKWMSRNSLKNQGCIDYVNRLCNSYGIEKHHVDNFINGEPALFVKCKCNIMILSIEPDNMWLQVYKRADKNSKDVLTMHFENDSCWQKGIEWVTEQERQGV